MPLQVRRMLLLAGLLLLAATVSASLGPTGYLGPETWWGAGADAERGRLVLWELRLPRVALAVLAGSGLAVAGAVLQAVFRNPLADVSVTGMSAGAGLGAAVALVFGAGTRLGGLWGTGAAACVGAAVTGLLVYALARRDGRVGVEDLLLIGLATSGVAGAGTTWLLLRAGTMEGRVLLGWLSGSLAWRDWSFVAVLLPVTLAGLALAWAGRRGLDLLSCGEETATCLGLETERAKTGFLLVAALLAGGAAAVAGPIPFVGLMTPHLVRGLTGGPHGRLLPGCALGGGLLLLLADGVARMASPGEELPVGLVTSLLGGLFFLALARRRLARPPG